MMNYFLILIKYISHIAALLLYVVFRIDAALTILHHIVISSRRYPISDIQAIIRGIELRTLCSVSKEALHNHRSLFTFEVRLFF